MERIPLCYAVLEYAQSILGVREEKREKMREKRRQARLNGMPFSTKCKCDYLMAAKFDNYLA
jgi:hypothetical protein